MKIKLFENIENPEELIYGQIQSMIENNQFLKGKVEANKETVYDAGDFILLLGDLSHITDAHVEEAIPGSKFNKGVDLKKAIINLVSNNKPSQMTKGFGQNEVEVNNPTEAEKFKWLGLDSKTDVGVENLHQSDINSEEFKSMNVYNYKDSRGNHFSIKVKQGEGEKTTFLSFIGAKLGNIGDKVVLSVMTSFPGKNGVSIANRNEFIKNGLYFTTTSKEVIEMSKGQLSENKISRFDEFETNESLPRQKTVDQWNKLRKMTKGVDIGDRISDLNKQGANIQYYHNVVDSGIESYEDYQKHGKKFIPSWNLKHLTGPFPEDSKKLKK
jgi:hypothetical protein